MKVIKIGGTALLLLAITCFAAAQSSPLLEKLKADIDSSSQMTDKLKELTKSKLIAFCTNPVLIGEVKKQNAQNVALDEIKRIDKEWSEAEDELPIHQEKTGNACAKEIISLVKDIPEINEVFVMDNQGANVGQNALTSDYWQGDEEKFQKSYNNGQGGIDISSPKLDKSTNTVDQKISLPIIDETDTVIGAICIGVRVE